MCGREKKKRSCAKCGVTIIVASVSTPRILERLLRLDGETVDGTDSRQHHDRHPKPTFSWRTCDIAPSLHRCRGPIQHLILKERRER